MLKSNLIYINTIVEKKYKKYYFFYFFFSIFIALLETVGVGIIPAVFALLLDKNLILEQLKLTPNLYDLVFDFYNSEKLYTYISILLLSFFFLKIIINLIYITFEAKLLNNIKINLSTNIFKIYLSKNYLFHSQNNPIVLQRNITGEVNSSIAYLRSLIFLIREISLILLVGLMLLIAHFKSSIIIFLSLFSLGFIYIFFIGKPFKKKVKVSFFERGEKAKIINQILNSIIEIKLYKRANFYLKKFNDSITRECKSLVFYEIFSKVPKQILEFIIIIFFCIAIIYSNIQGIKLDAIISLILLYLVAALRIYPSLNNLIMIRLGLIQNQISVKKISGEIVNSNFSSEKVIDKDEKFDFQNQIEIKNLNYKYPNRSIVLKNINLTIKKNNIIGIIGKTGSGKSTLVKIIMGLIDPSEGHIHIDGKEIKEEKYKWQNTFAYISQNFHILDNSILDNIIFGCQYNEIDQNLLSKALEFASLNNFINELPEKLNTQVGPNGKKLSGGQIQRLGIARAIYQNRDIMVFDESTNSVDEKTEKEIINKIYDLKGFKTVIIITHNKNLLNKCDKIYNIMDGELLQSN